MAWSSPRTWSSGEYPTAAEFNQEIRDNLNAQFPLGAPAWTSYTPTDSNVTLGNGTRTARYMQIGKTVHFSWSLTFGSTTAFTGTVFAGLPVAAAASNRWAFSVYLLHSGVQNFTMGAFADASGTTAQPISGSGGGINATTPWTWTTNDRLVVTGTYEAA